MRRWPGLAIMSGECIEYPAAWASRCRTVDPGGPASVSSSTTPSSIAICAARATSGLVTDASAKRCCASPYCASTPDGATTTAAALATGQSAMASSAVTCRSLVGPPRRDDRRHMPGVRAAAAAEHPDGGQSVTKCGVARAEVDGIALVEFGRLVELGMASGGCVRPEPDEPSPPRSFGRQCIGEMSGVSAVDHEIRRAGAGRRVDLLDRIVQWLACRKPAVGLDGERDGGRYARYRSGAHDADRLLGVGHRGRGDLVGR